VVWNGTVQPQPGSCHTRYGEERGRWAQTRPGSGTTTTTPTTHGFALWSCVGDPSPPGLAWRHTRLHTGYALLTWYEGRGNGLTVHGVGVFGSEGCVGRQAGTVSWSWFLLWGADRQTDRQRVGDVTNAARRRTAHDGDDDDDDVPFPPVRLAEPPRDCPSRPFIKELNQQSGSRRGGRRLSGRDMATRPVGILFFVSFPFSFSLFWFPGSSSLGFWVGSLASIQAGPTQAATRESEKSRIGQPKPPLGSRTAVAVWACGCGRGLVGWLVCRWRSSRPQTEKRSPTPPPPRNPRTTNGTRISRQEPPPTETKQRATAKTNKPRVAGRGPRSMTGK